MNVFKLFRFSSESFLSFEIVQVLDGVFWHVSPLEAFFRFKFKFTPKEEAKLNLKAIS